VTAFGTNLRNIGMVFKLILTCHTLVMQNLYGLFLGVEWVTINKSSQMCFSPFLTAGGNVSVKLFKKANRINTIIKKWNMPQ
jgi:hypothetical protein